jgi:hypothetical protein
MPGYGWVIGYHGAPGDDERYLKPDTPDDEVLDQLLDREGRLGFGGHTHLPMDRDLGRWRVANPGSVGLPATPEYMDHASYVLASFDDDDVALEFRRAKFDLAAAANDMKQLEHPMWPRVMEMIKTAGY